MDSDRFSQLLKAARTHEHFGDPSCQWCHGRGWNWYCGGAAPCGSCLTKEDQQRWLNDEYRSGTSYYTGK